MIIRITRVIFILLGIVHYNIQYAQNSTYLDFPTIDSLQERVPGERILSELNWESIKIFCDTTEGHYARESHGELFDTYQYTKQGYTAHFKLTLYNGLVLRYRSHVDKLFNTNYFDRELWLNYVRSDEELKKSKWLLSEDEMDSQYTESIQAYLNLLGFDTRDEYGWICEYSASGFPPEKRLAVIDLIKYGRRDFLAKLLDHPNVQTKIYAADALIYLDIIGEIESVRLVNYKGGKRNRKYHIKKSLSNRLSKSEWRKIKKIRDSNYDIITCGNMGSYKQYRSTSKELLSDESISKIYSNYQNLRLWGFLY